MLEVIDLGFDYQEQPVLEQINFHLLAGGLIHLKGANGAGKTTLIKLIAGLYRPLNGRIVFEGQSIESHLAAYQQQLCFVGHKTGINPFLTIKENCFFDLHYNTQNVFFENLIENFHLENHLLQPCGLLSAGQRRQVALLRLWMTKAKLWLLDEPLVALDTRALSIVMAKISSHRADGGAVLLTSHQELPLSKSEYEEYLL
jgi:heme exporter protein A